MKTILITGANRGIGLEFVKQYLEQGWQVFACCRAPQSATQLQAMACSALRVLPLDVADSVSIQALSGLLKGQTLSLFINNAGIYGQGQSLAEVDEDEWLRVFRINTIAPLLLTRTLLPLMDRGSPAKLAYLSSKMGSIADNSGGATYVYRSSKTALNQVIKSLSIDLANEGMLVAALHPGWVKTEMGGPNALIDTQISVNGMRKVLEQLGATESGGFYNYDGVEIPW
jgi:NAD(P)-dependent dehydrogenase (short-subunit alcohol dehydrogenase family)